jgi:GNAT superfamily N-acetyltransferase
MKRKNSRGGTSGLIIEDGASCWLSRDFYVSSLYCPKDQRNKGNATRLIKGLVRVARRLGKRLTLRAAPYGDSPYNIDSMIEFYKRCGLKVESENRYNGVLYTATMSS